MLNFAAFSVMFAFVLLDADCQSNHSYVERGSGMKVDFEHPANGLLVLLGVITSLLCSRSSIQELLQRRVSGNAVSIL